MGTAPAYADAIESDSPAWGEAFTTSDGIRLEWVHDMAGGSGYCETDATFNPSGWVKMTTAEQETLVRPFYAAYCARRAELDSSGAYPYNASFVGFIGIPAGTPARDEETAVYLLQALYRRQQERALLAAFVADGAREISADDVPAGGCLRGTVAVVGEYSGDTGYRIHERVRVMRQGRRLVALPAGARTNGFALDGRAVYFLAGAR